MNTPKVSVVTVVRNNNKTLLGYRKSKLGKNTWGPPGGKLDPGEDLKNCGIRELKEETNLTAKNNNLNFLYITNDIFSDEHFVSLYYEVKKYEGEVKIMEPEKCEHWKWFDDDKLPNNLFFPFKNLIEEIDLGYSISSEKK